VNFFEKMFFGEGKGVGTGQIIIINNMEGTPPLRGEPYPTF
jgi:hypothetical protein